MAGGRPTKYKPEYCEQLVELMSQGLSFEACCGHFRVAKNTGYEWLKNFPEFQDAKRAGEVAGQLFWEKAGIDALFLGEKEKFTSAVWVFTMKNRFGWRDAQQMALTGPNGEPLKIGAEIDVLAGLAKLSESDLDARIQALEARQRELGSGND